MFKLFKTGENQQNEEVCFIMGGQTTCFEAAKNTDVFPRTVHLIKEEVL